MGKVVKVSGPLVVATGLADANMSDADHVGHIGVRQARSHHQRPGNFNNFTAQIR